MTDMMNKTLMAIMTAFVAIIILTTVFIPVTLTQIGALSSMVPAGTDVTQYTTLISAVIFVTIACIIIGVIRWFMGEER